MNKTLSVSIVTFKPDVMLLHKVIVSLNRAAGYAEECGLINDFRLIIVDNSPDTEWRQAIRNVLPDQYELISAGRNLGFGSGHNKALSRYIGRYHLILNPDVVMAEKAIAIAVNYLSANPTVGVVSPNAKGKTGHKEYLSKTYPSVLDLVLRGFAPPFLKKFYQNRLAQYELRRTSELVFASNVPIISGCFMLIRREVLDQVIGFSPSYFLYFEDFDLSLRIGKTWDIAYVPKVEIIHYGGQAAKKGAIHIVMFARSGYTFFSTHGWKWW